MYEAFFSLKKKPFSLIPDPDAVYPSSTHKKAFAYLVYGLRQREGIVILTGEIGSGKTTLIKKLLKSVERNVIVASIGNTNVNSVQLLELILQGFNINSEGENKAQLLLRLKEFLYDASARRKQPILIVDEAQNLDYDEIEEVRLLSNLETISSKLIQIILVGQPQLRAKLDHPAYEQLQQRVTVRYHIRALDKNETTDYINHRLRAAGASNGSVFSKEAVELVYEQSKGIPRMVNVLCDTAMLYGFIGEKHTISADIVDEVIKDYVGSNKDAVTQLKPSGTKTGEVLKPLDGLASTVNNITARMKLLEDQYRIKNEELDSKREEILALLQKLHEKERELVVREAQLRYTHPHG